MTVQRQAGSMQQLLYPSPFHLEDAWQVICENKNRNCSQQEIDILIAKEILNRIDIEILRVLGELGFVNTYNITSALTYRLPETYQKESYQRNFRKMVRAGLLMKYSIRTGDASGYRYASPMHFYSLTPGAQSYMEPHIPTLFPKRLVLSHPRMINCLSISQVLIQFLRNCPEGYTVHPMSCRHIGGHAIVLDGLIRGSNCSDLFKIPLQVILVSMRDSSASLSKFSDRLLEAQKAARLDSRKYSSIIVFVTESLPAIRLLSETEHSIDRGAYFDIPVYYTYDMLSNAPLFKSLFKGVYAPDGSFSIERVELMLDNT